MTRCEYLQTKKDECVRNAIKTNDVKLKIFFRNAAEGFQRKLENLTIQEAGEIVE